MNVALLQVNWDALAAVGSFGALVGVPLTLYLAFRARREKASDDLVGEVSEQGKDIAHIEGHLEAGGKFQKRRR